MSQDTEEPIQFPLRFPIKVMGATKGDFQALVISIVKRHVPDFDDATVEQRDSRNKRFVSVTVTFTAISRDQLDDLYRELTAHDEIVYVL